ncbi:Predicted arabinose efflux permease, MFS family [Pedobacter westerhofensis]|uniref:Predicted arabinose efflux permease, MFS family n=1 Tax=Pedobacter westerhofensis TaxID=425512 RepID=A0A521EYN9_9SPHI|nr:MFS transporter [Pedobacter westerhofensis]SMO88280.1 Predicted arabinose efflux permease, MFS family [Pedobacter westerhofensis]
MIQKLISSYKESFSGLSRETWVLSIVMFINRCSSMAVPFMSLYMTQYLHRPMSDAGLIIALFGAGSLVGATVGGKLTDVIGFGAVQIYSSIIGGLFFILYSTITHFELLCLCTLLISFFSEAFKPANYAAITVYAAPGTTTRSFSLNRLANNMGFAIGSGIGGIIASFSYPMLFIVDGGVSVLAGIAIFFLLPAMKTLPKTVAEKIKQSAVIKPWKDVLFVKFLLLNVLLTICFFLLFRVVPLFYKEVWHIDEFWIGLILGSNGLIIALFEMVMISRIENKRSPIQYIVMGVLMIALSYCILLLPGIIPVVAAVLVTVTFTIGEMLALPFINTFVMSRTNDHNRGQYAAGYTMSWSVSQVIGPSAGFYLAEMYGYNWLWICLIVLLLICAWGFKLLGRNMD